jgi:hypothetical protein
VKWWAFVGVLFLAVEMYQICSWLVQGHARPGPVGSTPLPAWMHYSLLAQQIIFPALAVVVIYKLLIRPLRKERKLAFDGILVIAFFQMWQVQDPWAFYNGGYFLTYNAHLFNLGCPQCHLPGWVSPNAASFTEPIIWTEAVYVGILLPVCMLCNVVMRKAKERWPQLGVAGLVGVAFAFMVVFDLFAENVWIKTGAYVYGGSIPELTVSAGHWYQFPLYEAPWFGATWAAWACMRYFKNDKGESLADRGLSRLKGSSFKKRTVQVLAVLGLMNTMFFTTYAVPGLWFVTHLGAYPKDIVDRSYFTTGVCGQGTNVSCDDFRPTVAQPPTLPG